jgi:hypothetical protein
MAHDCHEQAHEGDATVCEMIHDDCIAFCTGGTGTETGTTMTTTTVGESDSGSTHAEEDTTAAHDTTAGHDESTTGDHGTGTETGSTVCDELGTGCHDIKTTEGQECHEIGHTGDVAACEKAYDMCAKICGL